MWMWAQEERSRHQDIGARIIGFFDHDYPPLLRLISQPPPVIFTRGDLAPLLSPLTHHRSQNAHTSHLVNAYVAIVGTRKPSQRGLRRTYDATYALLQAQSNTKGASGTVISGLALGVDGAAHRATLELGGYTAAVLGHGLDQCYPKEHQALADHIISSRGALISEQPLGTSPHPYCLVARDRIQSGLSAGVMITETGPKGGSLHTARFALKQSRVVCLPRDHRAHLSRVTELNDPAYRDQVIWIGDDVELSSALDVITQRSLKLCAQAQDLYEIVKSLPQVTYAHALHGQDSIDLNQQLSLFK
jgi:DNA protecting protein DprA